MAFTDFHRAKNRWLILTCVVALYTGLGGFGLWLGPQTWMPALILGLLFVWITIVDLDRFEIPDVAVLLLVISGLTVGWINSWDAIVEPLMDSLAALGQAEKGEDGRYAA